MEEKEFIYFVDLDYWYVCQFFVASNHLASPTMLHYITYKTEYPIYTINLDSLITELDATNIGFASPRFLNITISNWSKNGLKVGIGKDDTKYYTNEQIEKFNYIAEFEIQFEKIRRQINHELPSRLSCIYLAEDNIDGRVMLKNMFSSKRNFLICPITIKYNSRFHRADSKWITEYEKTKQKSAIENYWLGKEFDLNPEYEYLLEGIIELSNEEDKIYIESNYIKPY